MTILRSAVALLAGLLAMASVVYALAIPIGISELLMFAPQPRTTDFAIDFAIFFIAGIGGGVMVAAMAPKAAMLHAAMLCVVVAIFDAFQTVRHGRPLWFGLLSVGFAVTGLPLGAWMGRGCRPSAA